MPAYDSHLSLVLGIVVIQVFVIVEASPAFNCRNSLISDEWRQTVLDYVNDLRRAIALGKKADKTFTYNPYAKNMNRLNWDCNMEDIAFERIRGNCSRFAYRTGYNQAQEWFKLKNQNCDITRETKTALDKWYDGVDYVYTGNQITAHYTKEFNTIAIATTTGFACTYEVCKRDGTLLCLFNGFMTAGLHYDWTYTKSEICTSCAICIEYLCETTPYTPVTTPPTCNDDKLTKDSNNAALWMHNYYRRLLASGWASDAKTKSGFAEPAKEMLELEYDCAVGGATNGATNTYNAIKDCPLMDPKPTPGYSMNFLRLNNYTISEQGALEQAIKTWWGELETKGLGSHTIFDENSGITTFANMAYDQAEKVACAVQNCIRNGQTLVMCQYSPAIIDGKNIYQTGKVCSGCKKLGKNCSNPRGLCENP